MNLKTPENRLQSKKNVQAFMLEQLNRALYARRVLGKVHRVQSLSLINEWKEIVARIEARAVELGYSEACKTHIPICRGECCKWHFPEKLYDVHFFVSLNGMTPYETECLIRMLSDEVNETYQCPMLLKEGCFFSFENRPVLCSAAYPCFAENVYWRYLENKKIRLGEIYQNIENLLKSVCD
jgi:hypothetical protein